MNDNQKRNKEVKIRLTEDEHRRLQALATGQPTVAGWLRELALSAAQTDLLEHIQRQQEKLAAQREAERVRLSVDPELLRGLKGIGNNVNQIARVVNAASKSDYLNLAAIALELNHIAESLDRLREEHSRRGDDAG